MSKKIRKLLVIIAVLTLLAVLVALLVQLILTGYNFTWTGFSNKTLWDWLNLLGVLAIPVVVGLGAAWFTTQQGKVSDRETTDNQREAALQAYFDKISELLLHEHLEELPSNPTADGIARARTVTVLHMLDSVRRGSLIRFLSQTGILPKYIEFELEGIDLSRADLNLVNLSKFSLAYANLSGVDLSQANLSGAFLYAANLKGASLIQANLSGAYLSGANLRGANLSGANLSGANLSFAALSQDELREVFLTILTKRGLTLRGTVISPRREKRADLWGTTLREANLKGVTGVTVGVLEMQADTLKGATMPDGSKHP